MFRGDCALIGATLTTGDQLDGGLECWSSSPGDFLLLHLISIPHSVASVPILWLQLLGLNGGCACH
jgi:hypothetical protein